MFKINKSAILTVVTCVVLSGLVGYGSAQLANNGNKVVIQEVNRSTFTNTNTSSGTISDVVEKVANSVVEITTETVTRNEFLGQYVSSGAGSGVIISEDGYIITNEHVIDDAEKIMVRLSDGTTYEAKLVGKDSQTDIAVIKIDGSGLTFATLGDSSNLKVGEPVIAIGNPLGELGGTVTNGIVSALDRSITIGKETMTLIQTSAAINPGNSGGGLFNMYGELIGVVNAKSSGSDIEGLGFAVPINTAKEVAYSLIENGFVTGRPILGVTVLEINNSQMAMMYNYSEFGVYVQDSINDSFKKDDKIISINDEEIESANDLKTEIKKYKVGDTVEVNVLRDGKILTLKVALTESQTAA